MTLCVLVVLHFMLVSAIQPAFNITRVATAVQSPLRRAARTFTHRLSFEKKRLPRSAKSHSLNRRLQTAPCHWQGGACTLTESYAEELFMHLPLESQTRTFYEQWRLCVAKSISDCGLDPNCYWDAQEGECDSLEDSAVNVQDWFNFDGCGILESTQVESQCEGISNCASNPDCSMSSELEVGSNGLCHSTCQYTGNIFASACGSGFDIDTAIAGCAANLETAAEGTQGQVVADCITEACPAHGDYWGAFFPQFWTCLGLTAMSCANTAGCMWAGTECAPSLDVVMRDAIPADCSIRDFFIGTMECEASSNCASTDCALEASSSCQAPGVAPTAAHTCTLAPERMFSYLAAGTCHSDDAQAYTRSVLTESRCAAATTDSTCGAVMEATSECPTRAASHANRVWPSLGLFLITLYTLLALRK